MSATETASKTEKSAKPVAQWTFADLKEEHREAARRVEAIAARWALGLAVGNGAGLVALSSQIIPNLGKPVVGLLIPSAWFFALGLFVAGVLPGLANARALLVAYDYERSVNNVRLSAPEPQITFRFLVLSNRLFVVETAGELLAALFFCAALIYPLVALTRRYMLHGAFA